MGYARNVRWKTFVSIFIAITFGKLSFAGNVHQTTYWYLNGQKQYWTPQLGNVVLQLDSSSLTAISQKTATVEHIGNTNYLHIQLPTDKVACEKLLSEYKSQYPSAKLLINYIDGIGKSITTDDRIFVSFTNLISDADLLKFQTVYNLQLENPKPNYLAPNWKYVYIFRQKAFSIDDNTVALSAKIFEEQNGKVLFANPNRVAMPGQGFQPDGTTNDPDLVDAWFLDNQGQRVVCASNGGTNGADAKIEQAWGLGYTGQGIKIGVVDFGGFDYSHPDMQGQILSGWNCVSNTPYDANNATYDATFTGHGMAVAGLIGANGNNGIGSAGGAYGAKIVPFFVNGQEDAQLVIAMQKAVDPAYDVDVLNFSLGIDHPSDAVRVQIENLANAGRVRYGKALGVVMVASHGNNGAFDGTSPQWPAAYPQVISVGASTPDDKLKVSGDNWNLSGSAWASNYGNFMSVVSPGVCLYTTNMTGGRGYGSGDYVAFGKTSAATPIVTSVAALVLSKNGDLHWDEVKSLITSSADKVHSDTYNYNEDATMPGHNKQMGYGRINAYRALSNINVGIAENTTQSTSTFSINNPVNKQLVVKYHLSDKVPYVDLQVFDMSGRLMLTKNLGKNEEFLTLEFEDYSPGMYFARFMNKEDELVQTVKFVKLW